MLNGIKSGLIMLQDVANKGKIKFSNIMATKIFNNLRMNKQTLTQEDLRKKIFEKVTFDESNANQ